MTLPNMHDSGKREEFASGAVRDTDDGKPRPDLISPHANLREGAWLARGAEKYKERNWEGGLPISRCIASLTRHLEAYKLGSTDEDHMAAIRTNAGFILHYEEEIKTGRLPATLDDMPHYDTPKPGDTRINPETGMPERYMRVVPMPHGGVPFDYKFGFDPAKDGGDKTYTYSTSSEPGSSAPTFYIAGPMRGYDLLNFLMFDKATEIARGQGLRVISPAEMDRECGIDPAVTPPDEDIDLLRIIKRDCETILTLNPARGDGMILLPGWEKSMGARAEVALGLWMGLYFKCYDDAGFLCYADRLYVEGTLFHQGGTT